MSQCTRLSGRMPVVALGRAHWTEEETLHLRDCESCRREWELVRITSRLGDGLLPAIDAGGVSSHLLQRLGRPARPARGRPLWGVAGLAAAAAVAAVLWTGRPTPHPVAPPAAVAWLQIPLPELDGLEPAELDSVLHRMDQAPNNDALDHPELGDLDSDELETVLDFWEG